VQLEYLRRQADSFPVSVGSLGVPMSPKPGNERVRALIARGLISTERTHSHENYPPAFCVLVQSTYENRLFGYFLCTGEIGRFCLTVCFTRS
jgi:hypothetical protein